VTPDELADVAPEDFVAARDALAKDLKAQGKVAEAAEVKKLRKPTVTQWITEQVRRHHDDTVAALREASAAVAAAQEAAITKGDRDALREAAAGRKGALKIVGTAVDQVLARNGRPSSHRDEVLAAIESAVTAEVSDGVFGLRDDLPLPKQKAPTTRDREKEQRERERREQEARAEIEAAEARVRRARDELEKAEAALAAVMERHGGVERDA
jgi:hypothetical protein